MREARSPNAKPYEHVPLLRNNKRYIEQRKECREGSEIIHYPLPAIYSIIPLSEDA